MELYCETFMPFFERVEQFGNVHLPTQLLSRRVISDASENRMRAVSKGLRKKSVVHVSRKVLHAEKMFSRIEKEALTIIFSVKLSITLT